MSVLWVPDAEPAPGADPDGWWAEGLLHELTHNLGAVGASAPHATAAGHCSDGHDVMCYDDGTLTTACDEIGGVMSQAYDCGGDDYFNVAPAAGSYLDTHFNVYDNRFLAGCAEAAPACGGTTVPGSNPQPPVSTAPPAVSGQARAGSLLAATAGAWANAPSSYAYQWELGDGATWVAVPGATRATYGVGDGDAGLRLRVRVIAANADGESAAFSAPTAIAAGAERASAPSRVSYTVRATRGVFSALTAKRPSAGLLLGP